MNRRNFIKLSALAAASAQASRIEGIEKTIFDDRKTLCFNKFGAFYARTIADQVVSTEPFEGDAFPNVNNNALPDMMQNETRVLHPYIRKSYYEKMAPNKPELRGKEEFVRVSWETALDLVAKTLRENYDKYGAEAIYAETYQWGSLGKVGHSQKTARRMLNILGGFVLEQGGYSFGAAQTLMPHVVGHVEPRQNPTKWEAILKNAKNLVFWGTDPVVSNEMAIGVPMHNSYAYYEKFKVAHKEGKMKIYSVDVYRNDTARYINSEFIGVRPCTDTAMMIGMCHHLYTSGLYDKEFIAKYTVGFEKFRDYFLGKEDGVVRDAKWASEICGASEKTIKNFAETLAKESTMIVCGFAIQRQDHGEQAYWALVTLASMLGQIGKEGCGFSTNAQSHKNGDTTYLAPKLKSLKDKPSQKYTTENSPWAKSKTYPLPNSRYTEALERPGEEIERNGKKTKLPHIRVAFNANGSTFTRHQDVNRAVLARQKIDTVITTEPYWTSSAKLSDIVLPVAIETERVDIDMSNSTGEYLFAMKPVVAPMGESRSDYWIAREICKRWGYEEAFTEGKDEFDWVKEIYADAAKQAKEMGYDMPSFEAWWEKGYFKFEKVDDKKYYTAYADFRADPEKNKLKTPSGKIELYSEAIAAFGYDDCPPHAAWLEPFEWLGGATAKYPLALTSPHSKFRLHSQFNNSLIRNYNEIAGREPILLSPRLAAARGIKNGDVVRVFNDRGEILCGAQITEAVPQNVVIVCEGAWYDPEKPGEKSLCRHGCVNVLTKDVGSSRLSQSNTAHTTLVQIEKYKGKIERVRAFDRPVTIG